MATSAAPVFYRTVDPVQNLQVRVTVRKLNRHRPSAGRRVSGTTAGRSTTPSAETPGGAGREGDAPADDAGAADGGVARGAGAGGSTGRPSSASHVGDDGPPEEWSRTFMWQEKEFSPAELVRYGPGAGAAASVLTPTRTDAEYQQEVKRRIDAGEDLYNEVPPVFFFSYVDQDGYVPEEEVGKTIVTGADVPHSELADSMVKLPMRVTNTLAAGSRPLSLVRREAPFRSMYIMAAVDVAKEDFRAKRPPAMTQVPLCILRAYTNTNLLEMRPGFDDVGEDDAEDAEAPYGATLEASKTRFKTAEGDEYEVTLTNPHQASEFSQFLDTERAVEAQALANVRNRVGTDFTGTPPEHAFNVFAFVEVVAAADFPGNTLFVEYEVRLPPSSGWRWADDEGERASRAGVGITHVSATRDKPWGWDTETEARERAAGTAAASATPPTEPPRVVSVAHFSYPIELQLVNKTDRSSVPESHWPELLFSVYSRDSWGIINVQGYGHFRLPSTPGAHNATVHTWRPEGSVREKLGSFFLGGAANMSDASHTTVPRGAETSGVTKLNKFGFRTVTSGHLAVRANIVKQTQPTSVAGQQMKRTRARTIKQIIAEAKAVRKLLGLRHRALSELPPAALEEAHAEVARAHVSADDDDDDGVDAANDRISFAGAGAGAGAGVSDAGRARGGSNGAAADAGAGVSDAGRARGGSNGAAADAAAGSPDAVASMFSEAATADRP